MDRRDIISSLPEAINCHILSFLPTKEAASTSFLSKKWRYLFAFVPNLDLDYSVYLNPMNKLDNSTSFMDFVDRVLALQGNSPLHKFSLKVRDGVDPVRITSWIHSVLERGVSDLDLHLDFESEYLLPSEVYLSKTLVSLKLYFGLYPTFDAEDVHLPKLKTLHIESVHFEKHGMRLTKLLSGCHILEDLVLNDISWFIWDFASVSSPTLKRVTFSWQERDEFPKSVSFDTPNLVYLKFTDTVAGKYPKVNFDSLVEPHIDLCLLEPLLIDYHEGYGENDMVGNATDFLMRLCNVKTLYLSPNTLQVLTYSCDAIPLFNNLSQLTIESDPTVGWQSLPGLLKNSPNLETLIFKGLIHKATDRCGDVCLCKPHEEGEEIRSCLSSSPVKVIKIREFGAFSDDMEKQIKYFLETMPNLEKMMFYYKPPSFEDFIEVAGGLKSLFSKVASSKCVLRLILSQRVPLPVRSLTS
ncbi:PREDICTED: F-box/LRR-repeat protein At4g14103-like isoform X1 [Camelina sativa]|uniref:F-box/LRR-repeat protein At4g14103-like isoform X1 n=1 Tax=Camelina sativa TaxID=90675 RepID=A0ABM0U3B6_CAMSA|nr:PREDICTED: F-box/LRR-repeat protein At4g14103-like isoform X1 [Camelina sativa]